VSQLAFDIDELIREQEALARPPWSGPAPLAFTTEPYTVPQLEAAFNEWVAINGHFGCIPNSHMWHGVMDHEHVESGLVGHVYDELSADLGCKHYGTPCLCVGRNGGVTRVQCDGCGWLHIGNREEGVIGWHDHHWPGWRDLPRVPENAKNAAKWAAEHYPDEWKVPGAPIITPRGPWGSRSVPGRSPWRGFDIASWWLEPGRIFDYDLAEAAGQLEKPLWKKERDGDT
jgi:hypothetical protein